MEGYYPATFGFEDDKQGTVPNGWSDNSGSSCYIDVVDEHAGHNNVLRLVDGSSSYSAGALTPVFDESDHGTIEFWIKMDDANDHHYCLFYDTSGNRVFYFDFLYNRLYHNDGESKCIFEFGTINDNTWYHIAIHFELRAAGNYKGLSQYQVKYDIDGVESRVYNCENNYGNIAQFELRTYSGVESEIFYVDAIGLSWYDAYNVGDNKKEGLLLKYDTIFNPLWTGYSFNGQENKTIYGNTTIPFPNNGDYTLRIYGNDSLGDMYFDEISFRVSRLTLISPYDTIYMDPSGSLPITFETITDLVWMAYSLDGQSNVTIFGNTSISMPADGYHTLQVFGKDSLDITYKSDICSFQTLSSIDIDIKTPEEIIYTDPTSGYYTASSGFESDEIGGHPSEWLVTNPHTGTGYLEIDSLLAGHRNVLEVRKNGGVSREQAIHEFASDATVGTVEFWLYKDTDSSTDASFIYIGGTGGSINLGVVNRDFFRGSWSSRVTIANDGFNANQWYHIRVDFDVNQGWQVQLGSTWYGSGYAFTFNGAPEKIEHFTIASLYSGGHPNYGTWLDALGYSWDPRYDVGDNLEEGLLLGFDDNCELDWKGYSIDNNPYLHIPGNFTIAFPSNGTHTIRVMGNISTGVTNYSHTRNFAINYWGIQPLSLNVINPTQNEVFGYDSPDFLISGVGINASWYSLDYGATNFTFTGFTGKIDQTEWEGKGAGTIPLRFYANNSIGELIFKDVLVVKDLIAPVVIINQPTENLLFGSDPPNYDISITEPNLDSYWYTLDNGATNVTIGSLTGTIYQSEWDKQGNGTVTVRFYARDEGGNEGYAEVIVRKDISDPIVTIISPSDSEIFGLTAPSFSVSVIEPDFDSIWYTLDNGIINVTAAGFSGDISQTEWNKKSSGIVIIRFYANDTWGNIGYAEVTVEKDVTDPAIIVNTPSDDDIFGYNAPSYDVSITDPNLDTMWYTLDNGVINVQIFSSTGFINQAVWNSKGSGSVSIRFYANDTMGNTDYTEVLVTKDLIDPIVSIISPSENEVFGADAPSFDISVTESNLDIMWYTLDGGLINTTFSSLTGTISQTEWDKKSTEDVIIRFYARDEAGNEDYADVIVSKDISIPIITINSPIIDEFFGFRPPQYDVTVVEPNIDTMWYTLDFGVTLIPFTEFTGTIDQTEWDKFGDGIIVIRFYVRDNGENEAFAEVSVTKDLIAPVITINEPEFGEVFGDISPLYSISIDETILDSFWYSLDDGQTNYTISELTGGISQSAWNSLSDGHITLRFYAKDEAGNVGQSSVTITKSTSSEPIPPGIPGYDLYLLLGALSIISAILIRKRLKSN